METGHLLGQHEQCTEHGWRLILLLYSHRMSRRSGGCAVSLHFNRSWMLLFQH